MAFCASLAIGNRKKTTLTASDGSTWTFGPSSSISEDSSRTSREPLPPRGGKANIAGSSRDQSPRQFVADSNSNSSAGISNPNLSRATSDDQPVMTSEPSIRKGVFVSDSTLRNQSKTMNIEDYLKGVLDPSSAHSFVDENDEMDAIVSDEEVIEPEDAKRKRSSDQALKDAAVIRTVHEFCSFKCGPECSRYGGTGHCVQNATNAGCLTSIMRIQTELWGEPGDPPPTSKERGMRLWDLQVKMFDHATGEFNFSFPSSDAGKPRYVCERAFAWMLGFNGNRRTKQYIKNKLLIKNGYTLDDPRLTENKASRYPQMVESAKAYIRWFRDENCDRLPTAISCDCHPKGDDDADDHPVFVVPYDSIHDFYGEYYMFCHDRGKPKCGLSTFRTAFKDVDFKHLRLMRYVCSLYLV